MWLWFLKGILSKLIIVFSNSIKVIHNHYEAYMCKELPITVRHFPVSLQMPFFSNRRSFLNKRRNSIWFIWPCSLGKDLSENVYIDGVTTRATLRYAYRLTWTITLPATLQPILWLWIVWFVFRCTMMTSTKVVGSLNKCKTHLIE